MSTLKVNAIQSNTTQSINVNSNLGNISNIEVAGVGTFSGGVVISSGSTSSPSISPSGDSNTGIFFPAADTVCIGEGGSEIIRVNSSGLVGIGSDSPTAPLNVVNNNASTPTVWLRNTSGGGDSPVLRVQGGANNDNVVGTFEVRDYNGNVDFKVGGTGNVTIGTGNLGIGTDNPSQKLEVVGGEIKAGRVDSTNEGGQVSFGRATDNATGWYIDVYGNTSTPSLRFVDVSNAAVRATIDGSGRLTLPYQPSFYTIGTNYTQSTGTSIIIPNVVSYNLGSHYNGTTGRFTAPIAGRYIFGFWGLSYPHNTEVNQIQGFVNGSGAGQLVQFNGTSTQHEECSGSLLLNLNANDVFDWRYARSSGTAAAYTSQWNMWGYLLG
jgi:hypothetical protein